MRCKEVQFNIEPYIAGELLPEERARVEEHLNACAGCRRECSEVKEKVRWIRQSKDMGVKMPARLEERLARRLTTAPAKKKNPWRFAVAASIALAIFLTSFYSGTIAQFVEDIPFIQKYFSFGDKGIEQSLRQGVGQVIEESKTADGITVTVHRLIADHNRTVVLYSLKTEAAADHARFEKGILNQKGQRVGGTGVYKFHEDLQMVAGRFTAGGIEELGSTIQLFFEDISFTRTYTQKATFSSGDELASRIPLVDGEGKEVGEYVINSAREKDGQLQLSVRWNMTDPAYSNPYITSLYQGESPLADGQFLGGSDYATIYYRLDNSEVTEFSLDLAFQESVAATSEPITFQVKIDKELAARNTLENIMMQRVQLEKDVILNFERIIATAGQTAIEYTVEADRERLRDFMEIQMAVYSDGERIWFNHDTLDNFQGRYALSFDPTISLENLKIVVKGYNKPVFSPIQMSLKEGDTGKTYMLEGQPLTVERIEVDAPVTDYPHDPGRQYVLMTFSHPSASFYSARISDGEGTRNTLGGNVYRLSRDGTMVGLSRDGNLISTLVFDSSDTEWSLTIDPYMVYVEKNIEVNPYMNDSRITSNQPN